MRLQAERKRIMRSAQRTALISCSAEAVRLHFDEEPRGGEAVLATLHLMRRHMHQLLPGAEPVIVDVRRGRVLRADPDARPEQVEPWLAGEAAAFAAMWQAAAA